MKKVLLAVVFLSATIALSAQHNVTSIQNVNSELIVNDSIKFRKGELITVNLPAGKDFMFIQQKKSRFSAGLLSKVAGVVGTGASAVGMGSGSIKVLQGASKVMRGASTVQYGANAIEKIQDLPISNDAKKIAGKSMEIIDWEFTNDGWIIEAKADKKKYEIYLQEAIMAGEINL